jgi:hypothetical protein|tara:strand:+ start:34 stop:138 length:105 start_codon:yes stop_codon:yes gene_type:complete
MASNPILMFALGFTVGIITLLLASLLAGGENDND